MIKKNVLIIYDDLMATEAFSRLLHSAGLHPVVVRDPLEAMEDIRLQRVDLVILDVDLPYRSGIEVLFEIRQCNPSLPVMVVSGYDSKEIRLRALEAGARTFIPKPVSPDLMIKFIYKILQGSI